MLQEGMERPTWEEDRPGRRSLGGEEGGEGRVGRRRSADWRPGGRAGVPRASRAWRDGWAGPLERRVGGGREQAGGQREPMGKGVRRAKGAAERVRARVGRRLATAEVGRPGTRSTTATKMASERGDEPGRRRRSRDVDGDLLRRP